MRHHNGLLLFSQRTQSLVYGPATYIKSPHSRESILGAFCRRLLFLKGLIEVNKALASGCQTANISLNTVVVPSHFSTNARQIARYDYKQHVPVR
jgi:hypothetical protein